MALEIINKHLDRVNIPVNGAKVYKDECMFSFDTPETDTGLYVCLNTFRGFGRKYVETYFKKTGNSVFLHFHRIKKEVPVTPKEEEERKVTRLAIGLEGGFDLAAGRCYEYEENNCIVVLPEFLKVPLAQEGLPEKVVLSVNAIIAAESATKIEEAELLAGTWDGEKRPVTKHAEHLLQLDNGVRIPPKGWKCELCDKTDNLWLNLTDGRILCGRKFFDGTGGNNHAVLHYQQTQYPLAAKLGTITPNGADVYSYDEDDMVEDPLLAKHLAHFGINIANMEKTDKSMIELEIDLNQRIGEWVTIQEAGTQLTPLYGAGYTGLANLGNSCYLNSVMQVIFSVPAFQQRYYNQSSEIFNNAPQDPTSDFTVQMSKLAYGLLSGEYSKPSSSGDVNIEQSGIRPTTFKLLVGRGHPEFSTKRQQDARDFFLHLMTFLERSNRHQVNPADCFKFQLEDRTQCLDSQKVKYVHSTEYVLSFPIPMEQAINKDQVMQYEVKKAELEAIGQKPDPSELVRPRITLKSCMDTWAATRTVSDFYSPVLKRNTAALKTSRLSTFPEYLVVQFEKYTIGENWMPKKLDVSIDVPDELDISHLRGQGLQQGEEMMPDPDAPPAVNPGFVQQLVEMGFPANACQRAVFSTNNSGVEPAMNWLMEHMDDPDFSAPFVLPTQPSGGASSMPVSEESLSLIMSMGFTRDQAVKALRATDNNLERAADWIFSHLNELDSVPMDTTESRPQFNDGAGKYKLEAFVSHMGTSTMVGHYVCHILKEGRWVIFNDSKVALSENPPKDLGYLYVYRRL